MVRIKKELEYALMSLAAIERGTGLISAHDIAEGKQIPEALLKKTLQRLSRAGIVKAVQGSHGGYQLVQDLHEVSIGEVEQAVFGGDIVAKCISDDHDCPYLDACDIREGMFKVQSLMDKFVSSITVAEFLGLEGPGELEAAGELKRSDYREEKWPTLN